jgi:hypothetical protein
MNSSSANGHGSVEKYCFRIVAGLQKNKSTPGPAAGVG